VARPGAGASEDAIFPEISEGARMNAAANSGTRSVRRVMAKTSAKGQEREGAQSFKLRVRLFQLPGNAWPGRNPRPLPLPRERKQGEDPGEGPG
jgi:hypothetical protein